MVKRNLLVTFVFSLFVGQSSFSEQVVIKEPENLAFVKKNLIAYHDSGQYNDGISKIIQEALYYLRFRIIENSRSKEPRKLAIVLDIDETSLSNYKDLVELDFGGRASKQSLLGLIEGKDPAINYTKTLFSYAKSHGVKIFFVTGRTESLRTVTEKNLRTEGYKGYEELFMKPNNYQDNSVTPYKTKCRKQIASEGYDIIENIGDQFSDLEGGYADMTFKIPNPYYYIP